jgi:hypothetical protein
VTGIDDLIADGDVAYAIIVGSATSSDPHYNNLLAANATVTNLDNDQAGIVVSPTSGLVTTEAGGTASFTIRLTSQPTADVTIPVSSNDTTEGTVSPASLVFTPENWSTPQTVLVTGVDDVIEDGNVSYSIITGPATSSDPTYHSRKPADVMLITVDDDIAGISVDRTGLRTTESGGKDVFSVRLNTATTADVTLVLFSSDLTEGVASPTSLVFTSRNWDTAQTVTVSGVDDLVMDGDVNYTIILLPTTSSIGEYSDLQVPVPIDNLVLVTRQGLATFAVLRRWQ